MKQRTRFSHTEDELMTNMNGLKDDRDVHSEIQLYRIKPQDHFIEAQVQEGDTLQAIALRFHCSISELKRINHIHKDNEIFARRTIKVPVTPYSVLTEIIPAAVPVEPVPSTSTTSTSLLLENILQSPLQNRLPKTNNTGVSNATTLNNGEFAIDCNAVVLNSTLTPSIIPYTDDQSEAISEDTQLLPSKVKEPVEAIVVKQLTSQGADFGLKWFHLLTFVLVLGVFAPIIFVLFFLDKHEHSDIPPLHPT